MKILQVTPRYLPQSGGVETHVAEISTRLVESGHEVTILTADRGIEDEQLEQRNGVRVNRYRSVAPNESIHLCPQITIAVSRSNATVVHAHNYHSLPLFFAAVGVSDQKFVITPHYHGGSANQTRDRLFSVYHRFGRWAVRQADEVVAVSDWESEQLATDFAVTSDVILNGLDIDRFRNAALFRHTHPYLLTVGRLEEYKGIQHVIQMLPELPDYDLLVAGSGPYRTQLEQLTREVGVGDRVTFLGYVDDELLPQLYAGAEAYVSLSSFEAYGMTVPEALASGTPCVVLERGALKDWSSNRGVIGVSTTSPDAVRSAILTATNYDIEKMEFPTWDHVTSDLEAV